VYKLVAPVGLLPVYPLWDLSVSPWLWRLPLVGLAFALAIVFALRQRIHGLALWGLSHFVILLSPALGLIPFGNMAVTYVSDHFVYVASIGFFISIGVVVGRLIERSPASKRLTIAAGTLACVALSVLTIRYIPTFRNSGSMWSATLAGNPDCYPAHVGLGQDHLLRGELTDAQYHYGRAVQSDSNRIEGHAGLGAVAVKRNDWVQAEASLRRALAIDPGFGPALADLGFVHQNNQQFDEALALYEAALRGDPRDAQTHLRAAELLLVLSRRSDALPHFQAVVDLRPKLELGYQGVAQCLRGLRRYAEAVGLLQAGLVQAPDGVALKNMLAITLAAAPDASLRDGPRALRLAEEVCQATEYKNPQALDTLAAALAEVGRFDEAARTARQAEALAKAARDDRAAQASAGWAAGYEQKRPRRDPA
jgi:tetratricopeptide (TPR) repeat protein